MITCRPSLACQNIARISSSISVALSGRPSHAAAVAWSAPERPMALRMNQRPSGTPAIAVRRCSFQCSAPARIEPSPRAPPETVNIEFPSANDEKGEPGQHRETGRDTDHGHTRPVRHVLVEAVTEVPGEVTDAVGEMEEQHEGEHEQD